MNFNEQRVNGVKTFLAWAPQAFLILNLLAGVVSKASRKKFSVVCFPRRSKVHFSGMSQFRKPNSFCKLFWFSAFASFAAFFKCQPEEHGIS